MNKQEIAGIIARIRMKAGLTQAQLGELLSKKQQTIASWEIGQSQPDIDTLFALCKICGTTVNDAFGFTEFALSEFEKDMIQQYRLLDASGKARVNNTLDFEYNERNKLLSTQSQNHNEQKRA